MGKTGSAERRRTPTIADVAARAEVSLSTVSRVMNGSTTVDPALSERVRDAARALGYSASPLARSLVLGRTQTVAVVVPDLGNPTFQGMLRGLSDGASESGYHVLVADSHERAGDERELAIDARKRCDAIVLCAPRMPAEELGATLPLLAPVVVLNRDPGDVPSVVADYGGGLTQLLQHLYDLNHRHLLYLEGSEPAESNRSRLKALREFGARHSEVRIDVEPCGVGLEDGHAAAGKVVASETTAALAFNDLVAIGLVTALAQQGVRVPEDVSVTGFDDIPLARYTSPPLTTATVPAETLGAEAWARISALLNDQTPPPDLTYEPAVVVRGSTGPACGGPR